MKKKQLTNIVEILGKFKELKRTGWIMRKVSLPESDADHSFGVALLVMMFTPNQLNKQKCMELALIHDLAEVYTGDFTPHDNITKEEKIAREREGVLRLSEELNWSELVDLVDEYNNQKTPEARFVGLIDKLETVLSAKYYDNNKRAPDILINEFAEYAKRCAEEYPDEYLSKIKEMINSF